MTGPARAGSPNPDDSYEPNASAPLDTPCGAPNGNSPAETWPVHRFLDRVQRAVAYAERSGDAVAVVALRMAGLPHGPGTAGEITKAIEARLRSTDTSLAFEPGLVVALLTGLRNAEDSASVAQELLAVVEDAAARLDERGILPVRAGIAVFPWDSNVPGGLLQHAKSVIPAANGPSSYHFASPLMQNRAARHQRIAHGLRNAVTLNELALLYQPQVDLAKGGVTCAEALIRWNSPQLGLLGPDHFISVAEYTGAIVPIGQWVLEQALGQLSEWDIRGAGSRSISVNVSPLQIRPRKGPALTEVVERALTESGIESNRLELEITESTGILDDAFAVAELEAIARMGVGLAVDDFGKGYTSITYLRRLPLKRLKIDREFIEGLPWSTPDFVLVESLVHLSHSFGLEVVAEGVTTHEQVATLRGFGCTTMQGFLFAPPLTASEFETFLRNEGSLAPSSDAVGELDLESHPAA